MVSRKTSSKARRHDEASAGIGCHSFQPRTWTWIWGKMNLDWRKKTWCVHVLRENVSLCGVCARARDPLLLSWLCVQSAWGDFPFFTSHVFVGLEVAYCLRFIQFHVLLLTFRGETRCGYFKLVRVGPWRRCLILILSMLVATAPPANILLQCLQRQPDACCVCL